jgi:hypothetical protein
VEEPSDLADRGSLEPQIGELPIDVPAGGTDLLVHAEKCGAAADKLVTGDSGQGLHDVVRVRRKSEQL